MPCQLTTWAARREKHPETTVLWPDPRWRSRYKEDPYSSYYGSDRLRFPGREPLFFLLLSTMMLPGEVTLIPQFLLFKSFGWLDTLYPLIVPAYFGSAFSIFLMRQFLMTIPIDFDEAAMLDGAGRIQRMYLITIPSILPTVVIMLILRVRPKT